MTYFNRFYLLFWLSIIECLGISCNNFQSDNYYKAGGVVTSDYPIKTNIKYNIIRRYLDTLRFKYGYAVPGKWNDIQKIIDLDENNKIVYFKSKPEEMYLISVNGMLLLNDVYNPALKQSDWISEKKNMPENEKTRVINRFNHEILDKIKRIAGEDGLADSLIYDP